MRYIRRYTEGQLIYLAFDNKQLIAEIHENNTFIGGFDVIKLKSDNQTHFNTIDAATNFIENIAAFRG